MARTHRCESPVDYQSKTLFIRGNIHITLKEVISKNIKDVKHVCDILHTLLFSLQKTFGVSLRDTNLKCIRAVVES